MLIVVNHSSNNYNYSGFQYEQTLMVVSQDPEMM